MEDDTYLLFFLMICLPQWFVTDDDLEAVFVDFLMISSSGDGNFLKFEENPRIPSRKDCCL